MKALPREERSENWNAIMHAFRKRDEQSFKLIFELHYANLVYFTYKFVKDSTVAEEIVSDSFIKLFDRSNKFEHYSQVRSFLYVTSKNASLDYLDKDKTYKKAKATYQESLNEGDINALDFEILHAEVIGSVLIELQKAAPLARKVFTMKYIKNLDTRKISEITGLNYQTVKNQTYIAMKLLKTSSSLRKKISDLL